MNAARWDASSDPWDMWNAASFDLSVRQQGWWALACVERIRELLPPVGAEIIAAVEESLERTDYLVGKVETARWPDYFPDFVATLFRGDPLTLNSLIRDVLRQLCWSGGKRDVIGMISDVHAARATGLVLPSYVTESPPAYSAVWRREQAVHANLLREVSGNPFRPVAFLPLWRTDTVVALARTMYDSRDFSAMPILADALQDAGCENEHVLNHCRDANATHVRGCWVLDGILQKS